ncbi:MAG: alpha/beta hydrolase [Micrococcales bacterium]
MALGEFSPAFAAGPPDDLQELQALEAAKLEAYERPSNLRITNITIPGREAQIPARLYQPIDADGNLTPGPHPLFVWFHGGAFIFCDIDMGEAEFTSAEIAFRANAVVINVDYRLANPDLRFPCCQVDGLDAVAWAIMEAPELNADKDRVFVGGASAGACLTGSIALMLRDRGINVAGFLPIYPIAHMLLPEMNEVVRKAVEGVHYFTPDFSALHNPWLMEGMDADDDNHVWPGETEDKSGQAPFLIVHAEKDSLRMSGEKWTKELRAAGVSVDEFIEPEVPHGYLSFGPTDKGADHTFDLMARWIKAH